jgi:hypothetical protein
MELEELLAMAVPYPSLVVKAAAIQEVMCL